MKLKKTLIIILLILFSAISIYYFKFASKVSDSPAANSSTSSTPPSSPTRLPVQSVFEDGVYTLSIPSSIGLLTYYNQNDIRWGSSIYGGSDSVSAYGCGPTVLSMLVSSFTNQDILPDEMACWARDHHYWISGSGSTHALIPEGAKYFGFSVEPFTDYTEEGLIQTLKNGSIFVALMGPGHFTSTGHFIIIANYWSGSSVCVADSNNLDNSQIPWDAKLILDELDYTAQNGGPLWKITIK